MPKRRKASASPTGGSARRVAMNSEKNGTVCWYSNASPNSARTPAFSASAKTSVNKRLFPMPGGPSMTSTPPRP